MPRKKFGDALRLAALLFLLALPQTAQADDGQLECITTEWKLLGKNHAVCVYAFTDPDIPGVTCYISQAKTGGLAGTVGLAEDPSNFALTCVKTAPIAIPAKLPRKENIFKESTNIFFKATRVTRIWDAERSTLVYLAISRHLIAGSPYNAVASVPVN